MMKRILSILLLLCAVICVTFTGCGSSATLNLNDYFIINTKGVNGYGEIAEYTLDYEAIAKKYGNRGKDSFVLGSAANNSDVSSDEELTAMPQSNSSKTDTHKIQLLSAGIKATAELTPVPSQNSPTDEGLVENPGLEEKKESDFFYGREEESEFVVKNGDKTYSYSVNNASTLEEAAKNIFSSYLPKLSCEKEIKTLSNGDNVKFTWDVDKVSLENLEKIFKIKIKFSDVNYKAEGLTELVEVDPFKYVEFSFYGESGKGEIAKTGLALISRKGKSIYLPIDPTIPENNGQLSNGDKIHVKIIVDPKALAADHGFSLTRTEADIPLHGLNAYGQKGAKNGEKKVINLNDYVTISNAGIYETQSNLDISFDFKRMVMENSEALSENVSKEDLHGYNSSRSLVMDSFTNGYAPFELKFATKGSEFSNGDVVTFRWEFNDENLTRLKKVMNVEFKYENIKHTVKGLKKIEKFDPFENFKISYDGPNGFATASGSIEFYPFRDNPTESTVYDFTDLGVNINNNGHLSNGDKIVISLKSFTENNNFLFNWGLIPTRTELEVTVSGLE